MPDLVRALFVGGRRTEAREANLSALLEAERARRSTWAGPYVTDLSAMQHLTVWSCISLICDAVGMLPLGTRVPGVGPLDPPTVVESPEVLLEPVADMDRYEWDVRMLWSVLMRGNAYGWITERERRTFLPRQVVPTHPDEVRIDRTKATNALVYLVGRRDTITVEADDMMHVRGLVLPGTSSVYGLSPVEYARQSIGLGLAAAEFGARFFGDGAIPSGILTTDQALEEDDAREIQDRWEEAHGDRSRRIAAMGGGLKYEKVSLAPEESQFLETRKFSRSDIAGFYRVPPHLIGDVDRSTSWGTGIEEQGHQFATYTLGPWIRRLELAWARQLRGTGQYVRYNTAALLRGRTLERFQAYTLARQGGWLNVDEVRALEELPPLPEERGQDYLQPLNYAPVQPGGGVASEPEPAPVTAPGE